MTNRTALLFGLLALSACAAEATGPAQSTGYPFVVNDRELETPGSLPAGFTTNHPFAPSTGIISQTRTSP